MNKRETGARYEKIACDYLEKKGYEIAEKNYRTPYGEIDIVAKQDSAWVFCEVKYRSSGKCGNPMEAVDKRKQKKISRAALCFYAKHGYEEGTPCRFDVIAVNGKEEITHYENAFEFIG